MSDLNMPGEDDGILGEEQPVEDTDAAEAAGDAGGARDVPATPAPPD